MQDVKHRQHLSIRPLLVLLSLACFLVVYVAGIVRGQPLTWVTISSTVALILLLGAGLAIESLLDRKTDASSEPAATYERSTRSVERSSDPNRS